MKLEEIAQKEYQKTYVINNETYCWKSATDFLWHCAIRNSVVSVLADPQKDQRHQSEENDVLGKHHQNGQENVETDLGQNFLSLEEHFGPLSRFQATLLLTNFHEPQERDGQNEEEDRHVEKGVEFSKVIRLWHIEQDFHCSDYHERSEA